MDSEQQAWDALRTISQAEVAARRHSPNNGTVPLVWGVVVFACMIGFEVVPPVWAGGTSMVTASAAAAWTIFYQRRLPVKPLKVEKPLLFGIWGIYHGVVLMGGIALGTHFWQTDCARPGTFTLIGLLDAAPLLWVGWQQRRACGGL